MKIKEKSTEEKVIRKYLLRLRQPRIKKKENRYYIRGYKGTEVIIRTDHEILKRIAYRRTCVKQVCIPGRYETETKYIYTRKENRRAFDIVGCFSNLPGLTGEDIGIIDVQDGFSYVDILNGKGDKVLKSFKEVTIKGKKVKIQKARK